jgi:hypothetical protein
VSAPSNMFASEQDRTRAMRALLQLTDARGRRVLDALYGFTFDLSSESHKRILGGILDLVKTDAHQFGLGIDIDDGRIKEVPLFCRSIDDLGVVFRNQLELFNAASDAIQSYYRVGQQSYYGNSVIFRQLLADIEARIETEFRHELALGGWDIDYDRPKPQPCDYTSIGHAVWAMRAKLALFLSGSDAIGELYDIQGVPLRGLAAERVQAEFVCAGGANNI